MGGFFAKNTAEAAPKDKITIPFVCTSDVKHKSITGCMEVLIDWDTKHEYCMCEVTGVMNKLKEVPGFANVKYEKGSLLIETNLPSAQVLKTIEDLTKKRAVLQGFGVGQSAVSIIKGDKDVMGVVRFQQSDKYMLIDGTVDGLPSGKHGIHIHEIGDLSKGCESIGGHYNPHNTPHGPPESNCRHLGDLGNITVDKGGRACFRLVDECLKMKHLIGRSIAISEKEDDLGKKKDEQSQIDGNSGRSIACGIIARSAGVFANTKRICACDGVVVWDERERPLAGEGRRGSGDAGGGCCAKNAAVKNGGTEAVVAEKKKCCCDH